jgi:hypothetical protein
LEAKNIVIGISDDNYIAVRTLLAPGVHPQVEYIMQVDIGKQRRNHRALRSTYLCILPFAFLHDAGIQPLLDQPKYSGVGDTVLEKLYQPASVKIVEGLYDTLPIISTFLNAS